MNAAKLALAALAALTLSAADAEARNCKVRVNPNPIQHNDWYFGMSVQLNHTPYGRGLQVYDTRGFGPARQAGLEPGDVILSANGNTFHNAFSNRHAVRILQNSVYAIGSPVGPIETFGNKVSTLVNPGWGQPTGSVQLQVLDSRTGNVVLLTVYPQYNGIGQPGLPVPTTTAMFAR